MKEETQHVLRMLEIAGSTDVPVYQGAEFPLLNSKEETERWEALYGKFEYKGAWTEHFEAQRSTVYDEPYHRARRRASDERRELPPSKRPREPQRNSSSTWCTSIREKLCCGQEGR